MRHRRTRFFWFWAYPRATRWLVLLGILFVLFRAMVSMAEAARSGFGARAQALGLNEGR